VSVDIIGGDSMTAPEKSFQLPLDVAPGDNVGK